MSKLSQNMMTVNEHNVGGNLPSAIFGSAATLPQNIARRPSLRMAMWPCIGESDPQTAMGLFAVLGYLLEQSPDSIVYRVFARLDDDFDAESSDWQLGDSQFTVDDWSVDDLDENIAIWGHYREANNRIQLSIAWESDFDDPEDEPQSIELEADDVAGLIASLPGAAQQILAAFGNGESDQKTSGPFNQIGADAALLKSLLHRLFVWDVRLLYVLAGWDWDDDDLVSDHSELRQIAVQLESDFAAWCASVATARALLPGLSIIGEVLVETAPAMASELLPHTFPAIILASGLHRLGYTDAAYDLLEAAIEQHPDQIEMWLKLVDLYARSGRLAEAIDACQRAIEDGVVNSRLYLWYGNALATSEQFYDFEVEALILVDPDDYAADEVVAWEAVEAYREALKLEPESDIALYRQLLQLVNLDPDAFWTGFEQLVERDQNREQVRDLLDAALDLEDYSRAVNCLEASAGDEPESDYLINMAIAYMHNNQPESALQTLQRAEAVSDSAEMQIDIERLMLTVHHPEFEHRFAELSDVVGAGNVPSSRDLEFLESVLEQAPNYADAYVVLGRAYMLLDETDDALEVLLDGQKQLGDVPDIANLLAQVLWESGEEVLAVDYLNKGLEIDPNHVPLLVRTGLYLFQNDQFDDAKIYLARAEAIAPKDPELVQARAFIASQL